MDEEIKKNILKTGTTTLGIVCKDGIVIAADNRITFGTSDNQGVSYLAGKQEKIYPLNENIILTIAGGVTNAERIIKMIKSELKLMELRSKSKASIKKAANLFATVVYQAIRQPSVIPSITHFLISGYDNEGTSLYDIMPDGHLKKIEEYVASGSGMTQVNPLFDSDYKKNMGVKEGVELAKKAMKASFGRDPASGDGIDVYTITREGIKKIISQTIEPNYRDK